MNKSDLKDGMIVEDKNGTRGIVSKNLIVDIYGRRIRDLIVLDDDLSYEGIQIIVKKIDL